MAQDATKVDPRHYKVLVDNPVVRILKVSYGAGEKSPMPSHPDAMLVPLTAAKVRFTMPDGRAEDRDLAADMMLAIEGQPTAHKWQRGDAHFVGRGVKHEAKNTSGKPIDVVIVYLK